MQRSSHRLFLRLLLGQFLLTLLLAWPFKAQAQDFHWSDQPSYDDYGPTGPSQGRTIRQTLMRTVYDRGILDLGQELLLPPGSQLLTLSVVASASSRYASLQLLEDGQLSGIPQPVTRVARSLALSVSGRSHLLEVEARGDVLIHEVVAEIHEPYRPGPGGGLGRTIRLALNQPVYVSALLSLRQLAQQQGLRLEGERVSSVTLEADVRGRGRAEARLLVNNLPVGQWQSLISRRSQVSFFLSSYESEIGREVRSLQLEVRGDVLVTGVSLELARGQVGPWPGPRPGERTLHLRPQRDLNGRLSQGLEQAVSLPREHSQRLVSAITLGVSSSNRGTLILVDMGRGVLERTTPLDFYAREVHVQLPQPVPLRDLGLNTTGHVRVETLSIEFLR